MLSYGILADPPCGARAGEIDKTRIRTLQDKGRGKI